MPEHFTKNTLETTAYCGKCKKPTQHRVDHAPGQGGRRGPCLECLAKPVEGDGLSAAQRARRRKAEKQRQNPGLFE